MHRKAWRENSVYIVRKFVHPTSSSSQFMSPLPLRLLTPAKLLFDAANKAGVPAILFGGAAANLNGGMRETKVHFLDI
jgi:hypothetical protein